MRLIYATTETMPFSYDVIDAARAVGATEIVELPYASLPDLVEGFNAIGIPTVAELQCKLLGQLEDRRLQCQNAGLVYDFPDGTGTVQTRDSTVWQDITFVSGQVMAAMVLQAQNVTTAVLTFRDAQNVNHTMTPAQVIDMGMAVNKFVASTLTAKWTKQAEIKALTTVDALQNYDMNAGWPA